MKSSFVRKGTVAAQDLGTRPGLHGQTLVSTGHTELDKILGGGLPLGALLLLLEDGSSRHHATLLRYFLGEGAACGQSALLAAAAAPLGSLAQFIPQQLKRSSSGSAAKQEEAEGDEKEGEYTLRIAWQYRRYLQPTGSSARSAALRDATASTAAAGGGSGSPRAQGDVQEAALPAAGGAKKSVRIAAPEPGAVPGRLKDWAHQFDLSRGLGEEGLAQCRAAFLDCHGAQPSAQLLSRVAQFLQSLEGQPSGPAAAGAAAAASQLSTRPAIAVAMASDVGQAAQPSDEEACSSALTRSAASAVPGHPVAGPATLAQGVEPAPPLLPQTDGTELSPRTALPPLAPPHARGPQQVGRLAVLSLGSPDWWPAELGLATACTTSGGPSLPGDGSEDQAGDGRDVLRTLLRLKALLREGRRCAAVVTVPAALHSAAGVARLAHAADAVLSLEAVADDSDIVRLAPDPASVAGLLHVRKLPSLGTAAPATPEVSLFLLRNKRRRLAITPVEIDPDAEAGLVEGGGLGGGAPAASLLCGGPPAGAKSAALDF